MLPMKILKKYNNGYNVVLAGTVLGGDKLSEVMRSALHRPHTAGVMPLARESAAGPAKILEYRN